MENYYCEEIKETLNEKKLKFFSYDENDSTTLFIPMTLNNIPAVNILLDIEKNGKCSIFSSLVSDVDEYVKRYLYPKINEKNERIAFASFFFDKSDSLSVSLNFYLPSQDPGEIAYRYLMTFFNIIEDVAPSLLESVWVLQREQKPGSLPTLYDDGDIKDAEDVNDDTDLFDDSDDTDYFDEFDEVDWFKEDVSEDDDESDDDADSSDDSIYEELFPKKKVE